MNMHQKAKILFYHNFFLQNACKKQLYFFCFGKMHDYFLKITFFFFLKKNQEEDRLLKFNSVLFIKKSFGGSY